MHDRKKSWISLLAAMLLTTALLFSGLPVTVIAAGPDSGAALGHSVTGLKALSEDSARQSILPGTLTDTGVEITAATPSEPPEETALTVPLASGTVSAYADLQSKTQGVGAAGDVIMLGANITDGAAQLTIGRSLTLDLNGYNLMIELADATGQTSNGIKITTGVTLTIVDSSSPSTGTLTVTNKSSVGTTVGNGAGINVTAGAIIIQSGTVIATGGHFAAGIGGGLSHGYANTGGEIEISGNALVTALGGYGGAGIGGGYFGAGGEIEISGNALVTAFGGHWGAGIGGGDFGTGGEIEISGNALVTSQGGYRGAGIGSGVVGIGLLGGVDGVVKISGGMVTATGGIQAAGIGCGSDGICRVIEISGGTVTATGGKSYIDSAEGIGGRQAGDILIYGENTVVTATKGTYGTEPDIGGVRSNVFVALPQGQLQNASGNIGNPVQFTANPASTDTVTATLPAPFDTAGALNILSSLGVTAKNLSVITTFASQTISFAQAGFSSITKTGTELMTFGAVVAFTVAPTSLVVTTTTDSGPGSLREAINYANTLSGATITFAPAINGQAITLLSQLPNITAPVTIRGNGEAETVIVAAQGYRHFLADGSITVTFEDMTLQGPSTTRSNVENGGVRITIDNSTLNFNRCTLSGNINNSSSSGGAVVAGTLNMTDCMVSGNTAGDGSGGGVYAYYTATLTGCTLVGNSTGTFGGGVSALSTAILTNCTLTGNTAAVGGGVYANKATLVGCTVTGNTAGVGGGLGMNGNGSFTFYGSIVAGNTGGDVYTQTDTLPEAAPDNSNNYSIIGQPTGYTLMDVFDTASPTLSDNGGPTQTILINPNGPAYNGVTDTDGWASVPVTDQRGMARRQGAHADIGAVELSCYALTLQPGTGGSITTGTSGDYPGGRIINIEAQSSGSYSFNGWASIGGGTLANASNASTTFTMPGNAAIVTASFTQMGTAAMPIANPMGGTYDSAQRVMLSCTTTDAMIYYTLDGTDPTTSGTRQVYISAIPIPMGTTLKAYAVAAGMMDSSVMTAVYTQQQNNNKNSGYGGGSSYISPMVWPVKVTAKPNFPTISRMTVSRTPDKNNALTYTITKKMAQQALDKAKDKAKIDGRTEYGYAMEFYFITDKTISGMNISFADAALALLDSERIKETSVITGAFRYSFDLAAIKKINQQSGGRSVTVTASRFSKLSDTAKKLIGSRPAWNVTINFKKDSKTYNIVNLGKGFITMGMKYTQTSTEKTGSLAVVYVPGRGKPQVLANSSYDNSWLNWRRSDLSVYGVGYITPAPAFTDTANHWAKNYIDFVASRGLLTGTTSTRFSPDTAVTRAMFITALGRLSGADVSGYKTSTFSDVKADGYYLPYIEWAVANKIVFGTGGGKFSPDSPIAREDMAVMMQNYANATGYKIPVSREPITFADASSISAYAKDSVTAIQQAGIIVGRGNNMFIPKANATRAEVAIILYRFVELVIDEGTARGWIQNDSGQWQYINAMGKAVTSNWLTAGENMYYFNDKSVMTSGKWLQIKGKWYYFDLDGKLANNTTIDGYTVGAVLLVN